MMTTYNDDDARQHTTTRDNAQRYVGLQWRHVTTNDNGWRQQWLQSAAGSYDCKPRFTNLLFCQLTFLS